LRAVMKASLAITSSFFTTSLLWSQSGSENKEAKAKKDQ
jgi:hypothetical protein